MTASQQPQREYIIREADLMEICRVISLRNPQLAKAAESVVKSRPHTPAPEKIFTSEECNDLCVQAADIAREAATLAENKRVLDELFPKPTEDDAKIGWVHNYRFIERISKRTEEIDCFSSGMEEVQNVLIALQESIRTAAQEDKRGSK
jgi:hypothetical protein